MEQLITIKAFLTPSEATMMQSVLAAEDIFCFLKDENSVVMMPYMANAIGGIKLQVKESDVQRAVDLLKEARYLKEPRPQGSWLKENKVLLVMSVIILIIFLYYFIRTIPLPW